MLGKRAAAYAAGLVALRMTCFVETLARDKRADIGPRRDLS